MVARTDSRTPTISLKQPFDDPVHSASSQTRQRNAKGKGKAIESVEFDTAEIEGQTIETSGLFVWSTPAPEIARAVTHDQLSALPSAPSWSMCEDIGWHKGRCGNRSKWGGWYPEVEIAHASVLPLE